MTWALALIILAGNGDPEALEAACERHVAFFAPLAVWARSSSQPAVITSRIDRTLDELRQIQQELTAQRFDGLASRLKVIGATHSELRQGLKDQLGAVFVDATNPLPAPCVVRHAKITLDRNPIYIMDDLPYVSGWHWTVYVEGIPPGDHQLAGRMLVECAPGKTEEVFGELTFSVERGRTIKVEALAARPVLRMRVVSKSPLSRLPDPAP